jgi:hypothetical protein
MMVSKNGYTLVQLDEQVERAERRVINAQAQLQRVLALRESLVNAIQEYHPWEERTHA